MDNKALGIKILKSTALFTGKAAWFLLCKACLAVMLIMAFIVELITSPADKSDSEDGSSTNPLADMHTQFLMDYGDSNGPSSPSEKPHS